LRSEVDSLHERYQKQVHGLSDILVTAAPSPGRCPVCGIAMKVRKTLQRGGATLAHGSFRVRETVYACPSGCKKQGRIVIARSLDLAKLLLPRSGVGYDLMVQIGLDRFVRHRQREEIRADLKSLHGIVLSTGEISGLGLRFLTYLEALHRRSAPALRAALETDGGWPLHIDATGEDGRGTMVAAFAGWRGWVLGAWKAPTERAEFILPGIQSVAASFGFPCAIMRDLGRAMTEAANEFVRSLKDPIPVLACHQHFLADIGKDLLEDGHTQLRDLFRNVELLPQLRAFVRLQGRHLGESVNSAREDLLRWLAEPDSGYRIPDGIGGIAAVRGLAQWVLDFRADGANQGFPFEVPYLDLYSRCLRMCQALNTFLNSPPADAKVRKPLEKLCHILHPVECDRPPFTSLGASLLRRDQLFTELRNALRLHDKPDISTTPSDRQIQKLNDIQAAVDILTRSLRQRRPQRGPAKDMRQAVDLILSHLDRHGPHLWGHVIPLSTSAGGGVRLVARTNNDLESFFHTIKHGERRRSGRKILTQDFERLPPAAALAINLTHADYVTIVCGSLDHLADAFAHLDSANRSCSIAARTTHRNTTVETASLSSRDRRLVRKSTLDHRINTAAQWCV
jgi:hypothetical protein